MGTNISLNLVCGTKLKNLGAIEKSNSTIDLYDRRGRKTGKTAQSFSAKLVTPVGEFVLADDEAILNRWSDVNFTTENIGYNNTFNADFKPKDWIVGCSVSGIEVEESGRVETLMQCEFSEFEAAKDKATQLLKEKFGYTGDVYIFALNSYC